MSIKAKNSSLPRCQKESKGKNYFHGYATYPVDEDMFVKFNEELDVIPEDVSEKKSSKEIHDINIGKEFNNNFFEGDLEIYRTELNRKQEEIRNEDEENNFYCF